MSSKKYRAIIKQLLIMLKVYPFIDLIRKREQYNKINNAIVCNKKNLAEVKEKKSPLNVLFFVIHESVWKLDSLYEKMEKSEFFKPIIIICPYSLKGNVIMIRDMNQAFSWFKEKDYSVEKSISKDGMVVDIKEKFNPDLIFYTNPHDITYEEFKPTSFSDVLSAYVPYSHQVSKYGNYGPQYNQLFHNLMWKIFTTNQLDKDIFRVFSARKGENVVVSGYPGIEELLIPKDETESVWLKQDKPKYKIIWAPHHTIEKDSPLGYSTFLLYADAILELTKKFSDEIQFAIKPHPLLRDKLEDETVWGKSRTDEYFSFWANTPNTQLEGGDYMNLFIQSDAIIHDSGSFLAEYLYVDKPAMYLFSKKNSKLPYNPFGKLCLEVYEKAYSVMDIEYFISETVIKLNDRMKGKRKELINNHLINGDTLPSDFILEYLKKELNINKC